MSQKVIRILVLGFLVVIACGVIAALVYQLPPIHDRISWRIRNLRTEIRYLLNPPERAVFVPDEREDMQSALATINPEPTATFYDPATLTSTLPPTLPGPTETPTVSPSPTPQPTPIPGVVRLTGVTHEYQQMNNCGPATLSMALSYWGWSGDQRDTRAVLRPNFSSFDDKNVSPYEMAEFVEEQTEFRAFVRIGGEIDTIKRLNMHFRLHRFFFCHLLMKYSQVFFIHITPYPHI